MKLQKGVHTSTGREIYFIKDPATFSIKDRLGKRGVGLSYWRGMWWAYNVTSQMSEKLQTLGVDTSEVLQNQGGSTRGETAPASKNQPDLTPEQGFTTPEPTPTDIVHIDRGMEGAHEIASRKSGFPVKEGIFSTEKNINVLGKDVPVTVRIDRNYLAGGGYQSSYDATVRKGWKNFPRYIAKIFYGEEKVSSFTIPINAKAPERRWNDINEGAELVPLMDELFDKIISYPNSKLMKNVAMHMNVSTQDPEFKKYVSTYSEDNPFTIKQVLINDPKYQGQSLPVALYFYEPYGELQPEVRVKAALDKTQHPQAPDSRWYVHMQVPHAIQNTDQFNQWLETAWATPEVQARLQKDALEYLNSFAYLQEDVTQSQDAMKEILTHIISGSVDTGFLKQKLMDFGFLRPSKRQKRRAPGEGMVPESDIAYVLDYEKITDASYGLSQGDKLNNPNLFYTAMAYYLQRLKRPAWGSTGEEASIFGRIGTLIGFFHKAAERYGLDLSSEEVNAYFKTTARQLFAEIFHQEPPQNPRDRANAFNDWWNGGGSEEQRQYGTDIPGAPPSGPLGAFSNYVVGLGIDPADVQANPKRVYRQLALQYHPDSNPNADPTVFPKLSELWMAVRNSRQASFNWLERMYKRSYKKN